MKNVLRCVLCYFATILLAFFANLLCSRVEDALQMSYKGAGLLLGLQVIGYVLVTALVLIRSANCVLAPSKTVVLLNLAICVITLSSLWLQHTVAFPTPALLRPLLLIVATSDLFNAVAAQVVLRRKAQK